MTTPMTADRLAEFTPESLREKHPNVVFLLRVPTWEQRDAITLKMYRFGVRSVSTDAIRAVMISELFEMKGDAAEEDALFMEAYWQQSTLHETALAQWRDREIQRLADIDAGAKEVDVQALAEDDPEPTISLSIRDRARGNRLTQELIDFSPAVRAKLSDQHEYSNRFASLTGRMTIAGWRGIDVMAGFETVTNVGETDTLLTHACIEQVRDALAKLSRRAWQELLTEAQAMYQMPRDEEGNSDSPLENTSTGDGSPPASDESATSDGLSTKTDAGTKSRTSPTPAAE